MHADFNGYIYGFVPEKYHKVEIENVMTYFQNQQKSSSEATVSFQRCLKTVGNKQCRKLRFWTLLLKYMHCTILFPYFIFMRIKLQTNTPKQTVQFLSIASVEAVMTAEGSYLKVLVIHELCQLDTIW